MRVDFSVPEQQIRTVEIGLPVTVTSEVGGYAYSGRIAGSRAQGSTQQPPRDRPRRRGEPRRRRSTRPVPARARRAARGAGRDRPAQTAVTSTLYGDSVYVVRDGEAEGELRVEQVFVQVGRRSEVSSRSSKAWTPATAW
jgi:membrane fusion protein (multidrug efflux system)